MTHNINSTYPSFLTMSPPADQTYEPLAGYTPKDPRAPECAHGWDGSQGEVGERQHLCRYCNRWIWEHSITEPKS